MSSGIEFNCLPTAVGSMPNTDAEKACALVARYLPDLPVWPQLPRRINLENMYVQFSEGFPGIVVEGEKIYIERPADFDAQIEHLYYADDENNIEGYGISEDYAAGLYAFREFGKKHPLMVKGQVTGPVSWGLCVTDREQKGILYDDLLSEAAAEFLRLKAIWMERFLRRIARDTLLFIDEPYLASLGSAFVAISSEQVSALLEVVLSGIEGLKGVHCCGSTDWSILLKSSIDVLSFDSYNYADSLSTYPAEVNAFVKRGGTIAWGIVTNDEEILSGESVNSLFDRLGDAIAPFTRDGIPFRQLISQGILTPSCGLASLSEEAAEEALHLLEQLSVRVRSKYVS
jgi:methionine synthase II (cobalamin-independent)